MNKSAYDSDIVDAAIGQLFDLSLEPSEVSASRWTRSQIPERKSHQRQTSALTNVVAEERLRNTHRSPIIHGHQVSGLPGFVKLAILDGDELVIGVSSRIGLCLDQSGDTQQEKDEKRRSKRPGQCHRWQREPCSGRGTNPQGPALDYICPASTVLYGCEEHGGLS